MVSRHWSAFAVTLVLLVAGLAAFAYSPRQDHPASIPLKDDPTWYLNFEVGYEIQDPEILFHDFGRSIENARQAEIIFLGWSKILFALDWEVFDAFSRKHDIKMFNLGLAGVQSGEFYRRVIEKAGLHPKMWVINADRDVWNDPHAGFFYPSLGGGLGAGQVGRVVEYTRLHALKDVVGRNMRWRLKRATGLFTMPHSYRSAVTGNWYLDYWNFYTYDKNAKVPLWEQRWIDGVLRKYDRVDPACPSLPEEIVDAKTYREQIGGQFVLIQVPSVFTCAQRIDEMAEALGVPAFNVDATQFSSVDGGGHIDKISARKYSTMFFDWLEQQPEFHRLFGR